MEFNIGDDLKLVRKFYNITQEQFAKEIDVELLRIARIESKSCSPRDEFLERFYGYCFKKGLKLNLQKEMFYRENILDNHILLTHASKKGIVGDICVNVGRNNSDFGNGFYCGETYNNAVSFISRNKGGCVYFLDFNPTGLKKKNFIVDNEWMLAIAYYRGRLDSYKNHPIIKKIISEVEQADYIVAPIADNRMFEIIDEFIDGLITDEQCKHSLAATNLGMQYVFLTEKATKNLKLLEKCYISSIEKDYYLLEQKEIQKQSFDKTKLARIKYKNNGNYIEELLK